MTDTSQPIGFFAHWHNKRSEYHADADEARETSARIKDAFTNAQVRGVRMYGLYDCRWSTAEQYFTFWLCPSMDVLEQAMDELERAGDFKFADSEHIIGVPMDDNDMLDEGPLAEGGPDEERPVGFFALWRQTDSYYNADPDDWAASDAAVREAFDYAREQGVHILGRYDCRWSSAWEYFTFWRVPNFRVLEVAMDRLQPAGDFWFAESRHIIGMLESDFRFARHIQRDPERTAGGY